MLELIVVLLLVIAAFVWAAGMIILNGWVLTVLWGWFIVPLGAPSLTIAWAVGIVILANFLKSDLPDLKKDKASLSGYMAVIGQRLLRMGFILGIGWIAHAFM